MYTIKRAFYIGRFQPYHLGHHAVLSEIAKEFDEIIIGIGSAQCSHEPDNPFTAGERVTMIRHALDDVDIKHFAIPIEDIRRNAVWVSHIISMTPHFDVVYSNNPLVLQLFEEAGIDVRQPPKYKRDIYSGTKIRRRMLDGDGWEACVPDAVAEVIEEIGSVERLRRICQKEE